MSDDGARTEHPTRPYRCPACSSVDSLSLAPVLDTLSLVATLGDEAALPRIPWWHCAACGSDVGWPLPPDVAALLTCAPIPPPGLGRDGL
jgi:hypothetical protein